MCRSSFGTIFIMYNQLLSWWFYKINTKLVEFSYNNGLHFSIQQTPPLLIMENILSQAWNEDIIKYNLHLNGSLREHKEIYQKVVTKDKSNKVITMQKNIKTKGILWCLNLMIHEHLHVTTLCCHTPPNNLPPWVKYHKQQQIVLVQMCFFFIHF